MYSYTLISEFPLKSIWIVGMIRRMALLDVLRAGTSQITDPTLVKDGTIADAKADLLESFDP